MLSPVNPAAQNYRLYSQGKEYTLPTSIEREEVEELDPYSQHLLTDPIDRPGLKDLFKDTNLTLIDSDSEKQTGYKPPVKDLGRDFKF